MGAQAQDAVALGACDRERLPLLGCWERRRREAEDRAGRQQMTDPSARLMPHQLSPLARGLWDLRSRKDISRDTVGEAQVLALDPVLEQQGGPSRRRRNPPPRRGPHKRSMRRSARAPFQRFGSVGLVLKVSDEVQFGNALVPGAASRRRNGLWDDQHTLLR